LDATNDTQSLTTQEDEASQKLRDIAAAADPAEGIRQGLEDVRNGRVRPGVFSESLKPAWLTQRDLHSAAAIGHYLLHDQAYRFLPRCPQMDV
jgi:hypothetical protein